MNILFLGPPCLSIEGHLKKLGYNVVRTEDDIDELFLKTYPSDYGVSYRYKKIIKNNIIELFAGNLINLHISLLPWNRGCDPNLWSYIDNTPKGVTIHNIDTGIDTGDILIQQIVDIDENTATLKSSYDFLCEAVEKLFIDNTKSIFENIILPKKQVEKGTYHNAKDKIPYLYLIEKEWWNTPVIEVINKREREREREQITCRYATYSDCSFIFRIASSEQIRSFALHTDSFEYAEHCVWMKKAVENFIFYIIKYNNKRCGYIRFNVMNRVADLSIAIDEKFRNKGIGQYIISFICKEVLMNEYIDYISAFVFNENLASIRLFEGCNFSCVDSMIYNERTFLKYIYPQRNEF